MRAIKQIKQFAEEVFCWEFPLNREFKRDMYGLLFLIAVGAIILCVGLI